jgi:3'-5' exoribonuclease 1
MKLKTYNLEEMNYIILDLEATCWESKNQNQKSEIIEIGAVKINEHKIIIDTFSRFVKPSLHPELSEFCKGLTTIKQSQVDRANLFPVVLKEFQEWIDLTSNYVLCSWGFYDRQQFKQDCELHQLSGDWIHPHISLKHQHAEITNQRKPMGMSGALRAEDIPLIGTHHRGIDDAKNIANIFLKYFDFWECP